jgi:hypothetical protein
MYQRIFGYRTPTGHTYCWLRLLRGQAGAIAVLGEIPGNPGASVTNSCWQAALALASVYKQDLPSLTLIEHYPPDQRPPVGYYDWISFSQPGLPDWRRVTEQELRKLGIELAPIPFWRQEALSQICRVGEREGRVTWQRNGWKAECEGEESAFEAKDLAQAWTLRRLAALAAEWDEPPSWLRNVRR